MTIGPGICGWLDITDPVERAKFELEHEEQEKRKAAEQAWEAAEAAQAALVQELCDRIEASILPFVRDEAEAVNATARIAPEDREVFDQFKAYCATWDPPLPAFPANPAAVCAFLVKELDQGDAHFTKRLNAISRIHSAVNMPDPTRDVLCQALVRTIKPTSKTGE
jgi:hypothetical protein